MSNDPEKIETLIPSASGVDMRLAIGDEQERILFRVNGQVYECSRRDARALGTALVAASTWDMAPRFHVCGAVNTDHPGHRSCRAPLGHRGGHSWDPDPKERCTEEVPEARRWRFTV